MSYQQKDLQGSMFKNDQKEKDTHPDYRGSCLIDGVEYWMDSWIKTADSGRKWMSFSFKRKDSKQQPQKPMRMKDEVPRARQTRDDDLPPF